MGKDRVVLVVDGAKRRALLRLALEVSGRFEVVGAAVDDLDVAAVVGAAQPDVVLIDLARRADDGLAVVSDIAAVAPGARTVLVAALIARHHATAGEVPGGGPRPAQLVGLLVDVLGDARVPERVAVPV